MGRHVRTAAVLVATLLAVAAAAVVIIGLQSDAEGDRNSAATLSRLRLQLFQARDVPWSASPEESIPISEVRGELMAARVGIERSVAELAAHGDLPEHRKIERSIDITMDALAEVLELVAAGRSGETGEADSISAKEGYRADALLAAAAERLRAEARSDLARGKYGTVGIMSLLFLAFAWFYWRVGRARRTAERLTGEKERLLEQSRVEALTDSLTGLRNRRALMMDLEAAAAEPGEELVLALLDLDGFKTYNDTFGHPAGDMLLVRLSARLEQTIEGVGTAYRMGGDEFCVLASVTEGAADAVAPLAASALSEAGTAFSVDCSYGSARIPADATDASEALVVADGRMYRHKGFSRMSPSRQSADVLLKLQAERNGDLGHDVGELAVATARRIGLPDHEIGRVRLAAELHDVGKAAIPDAILEKPGKLDEAEWRFMRRHTVIGESIVRAAPSLADTADLVRSSHERMDGSGYPDGLRGEEIPIGARIIAVCDAFDAIVSDRAYRPSRSRHEALAELRRCAGTQFDPDVVEAFTAAVRERAAA
jgi:diguanylate cyclase (GGDEF)-like protein